MQITYLRKDNIVTSIFNDDVELIANDKLGVCRVENIPNYDPKTECLKATNIQEKTETISKQVYETETVQDENGQDIEQQVPTMVMEERKYYTCDFIVTDIPDTRTYEQKVEALIRERYSVSDEFAILRQRDTKPEEFTEYNTYCENCKAQARG